MALLETLVVGVGAGVAKGVLKIWFMEDPICAGIGNSLIDFIKSRTNDAVEQRKVKRQFEQITRKVARSINEMISKNYPNISDSRKKIVANAAGETVNTTEYSAKVLVAANLSPEELLQLFFEKSGTEGGNPAFSGTGESPAPQEEQDLYRMILSEAAELIVDMAAQYPRYTNEVFSELLIGQDEHVKKCDLILQEISRLQEGTASVNQDYRAFEMKYRRSVIRRLDELQLFGVDLATTTKRYKLSTAYVSLEIERHISNREFPPATIADGTTKTGDDEFIMETVKVDEALAETSRLFIRGTAGSGKTTLLQWIAVMSAARYLTGDLQPWNNLVPFFIRLREFADKELPLPGDFALLINRAMGPPPVGWELNQLTQGRAIVLVDGLDELPSERMDQVRHWINGLADEFRTAKFVISSRPHAAEEGWLGPAGFLDAELQDMSSGDIESFVDHWHNAVCEGTSDSFQLQELDELRRALKEKLQQSNGIRKLATSPLLCAVICALHRDRMRNIPDDRIELYEACIDMFLRRDHERRIELPQYARLTSRQIKPLLSDLAYWYMRNGISLADAADVDKRIHKKLTNFKGLSDEVTATSVRKGLVARSGILREPLPAKIDFPHRTFQEFLAAKEIVEERDYGMLVDRAEEPSNWRETIVLAAGLANQREATTLITSLIKRFDEQSDVSFEWHFHKPKAR